MERKISKHVGCYGIVVNSKNQVLLIQKSRGAYKGKLDLPGGGIDFGETPEETLKREFQEEVGIEIENFQIYTAITHYEVWKIDEELEEDLRHYAIIYQVNITKDQEEKIKHEEDGRDSLGANWYDIDSLSLEELSPLASVIKAKNDDDKQKTWHFGMDNDRLVNLVLSGKKRATTSLYDEKDVPIVGEESILLFENGKQACITKTKKIIIQEFQQMTEDLTNLEGEGTYEEWKKIHWNFFKEIDPNFNENTKVVFEIFEVKGDSCKEE